VPLGDMDLAGLDEDGLVRLLTTAGLSLDRMAPINATLDALPPADREHVLRVFLSTLLTP